MLGFLSGFQTQIMGGMLLVILTMGGTGYWYYTDSQRTISILNGNIKTLEANQVTLETKIGEQNESIKLLENARDTDQKTVVELAIKYGNTQAAYDKLEKKFNRHNLNNLTIKKPKLIQNIINKATKKVFDDFEKLTDPKSFERTQNENQ